MKNKGYVALVVVLICIFFSCTTKPKVVELKEPSQVPAKQQVADYKIQSGDELTIKFFFNPELTETVIVRPDGKISLSLIDEVYAAGMSPAELDNELTEKYSKELRKPAVTVIVRSFSAQRIFVGGEVQTEGLIALTSTMTPIQAVFQAGGFLETAQPKEAILIRKGSDNRAIPVRLDLASALYGSGQASNLVLQADDIVYVPKSRIAEANKFVNQYIEKLLLFRGFSFGFSYELQASSFTIR